MATRSSQAFGCWQTWEGKQVSENDEIAIADEPVGALAGAEIGAEAGDSQLGQTTDGTQTTTATGTTTKP